MDPGHRPAHDDRTTPARSRTALPARDTCSILPSSWPGTLSRTRRGFVGWLGAAVAAALLPAHTFGSTGLSFPGRRYELALALLLEAEAVPPAGRLVAREGISGTLSGRIDGSRVDLRLTLPGLLPDYSVSGEVEGRRLLLRVDRGWLSPRLVVAEVEPSGSCPVFDIHETDREWRAGRCTLTGRAVLGGHRPYLELRPTRRRPRFDLYRFELACEGLVLAGRISGYRQLEEAGEPVRHELGRLEGGLVDHGPSPR